MCQEDRRRSAERRVLHLLHGTSTRVRLREINAFFLRRHLHLSNPNLLPHFLLVCASLRAASYAHRLYLHLFPSGDDDDDLPHSPTSPPSLAVLNALIKVHSLSPSSSHLSLPIFSRIRSSGHSPDRSTFAPLLKCCTNLSDPRAGFASHCSALVAGFESHPTVAFAIVEFYAGRGRMSDACRVFDGMPHREVVACNVMINGFCKVGDVGGGLGVFNQMRQRNVVTWNSMIAGLSRARMDVEAIELFMEMRASGFDPDDATIVSFLPVCGRSGDLHLGRWVHAYARSKGLDGDVADVSNAVVNMYCKCGDWRTAMSVFDGMPRRNLVSWNSMINGLASNGFGEMGIEVFDEMTKRRVAPNAATFVGVLGCCRHAGLVEKGRELFRSMGAVHGIEATVEHYGCMVDLFGRCGMVEEARELIERMPMRPSAAIWGALLGACRNQSNAELAEMAIKELIALEPCNSGNYVLLSNLYAETGRWGDAEAVRRSMCEEIVVKSPGQSSIESR